MVIMVVDAGIVNFSVIDIYWILKYFYFVEV